MLQTFGVSVSRVNVRDKINDYLPGTFQAVILLMKDVDEQSLGMAIKINANCSLPLIAIGSKWTRSKVLKAVKYGVNDIILAPVTEEDIKRKITCHMTSRDA
jgi:PleD family two-component response regulator